MDMTIVFDSKRRNKTMHYFGADANDWHPLSAQARLFMCYVATHPEKLDESRADQWRKVCISLVKLAVSIMLLSPSIHADCFVADIHRPSPWPRGLCPCAACCV